MLDLIYLYSRSTTKRMNGKTETYVYIRIERKREQETKEYRKEMRWKMMKFCLNIGIMALRIF